MTSRPHLEKLIARLKTVLNERGDKRSLAWWCGVRSDKVSAWLAGREHPNGQHALVILAWIMETKDAKFKIPLNS